ncbi:MAG: hypothetical protein NZ899_00860 [Thermoguttaceae bacterium]|nr:hypothetical protein [Thermoguttaceae bacterium]MDW8077444.1 hypothetical protein [Thermoguttaceae bacterium]
MNQQGLPEGISPESGDQAKAVVAWETLFTRRIDLLKQLHLLVDEQEKVIQAGEIDRLLEILAVKQMILTELDSTEETLGTWRSARPPGSSWPPQDWPGKLRQLWDYGQRLISELLRREKSCEEEMKLRRGQIAAQLEAHLASAKAQEAYRADWQLSDFSGNIVSEA